MAGSCERILQADYDTELQRNKYYSQRKELVLETLLARAARITALVTVAKKEAAGLLGVQDSLSIVREDIEELNAATRLRFDFPQQQHHRIFSELLGTGSMSADSCVARCASLSLLICTVPLGIVSCFKNVVDVHQASSGKDMPSCERRLGYSWHQRA